MMIEAGKYGELCVSGWSGSFIAIPNGLKQHPLAVGIIHCAPARVLAEYSRSLQLAILPYE
jgi:hypothetical protein